MELELKKERLDVFQTGGELTLSQEETAETIVPDYCPDVGRIIEVTGTPYVHSRELRHGTASVSGTVRVCVLYTGESGVRTLEFTIPFTAEGECRDVPEGILLTEVETEYLETRLLNPRKLFTHCKIVTRLKPVGRTSLEFASDAETDESFQVEKRTERQSAVVLEEAAEREFVFTDQLELPTGRPGAAELLCARVTPAVTEAKSAGKRLALRGVFRLFLLYLSEDGDCCSWSGELPFSQILDLDDTAEDARADVRLQLTGLDLQIGGGDPDGRLIDVTLYVHADALVYRTRELTLLNDLYSTAYPLRCTAEPLELTAAVERQNRRQNVRETLETGAAAEELLSLSAVCGPVSVSREDGAAVLRCTVTVRALYLDEGGVPLSAERRLETGCRMEGLEGTVTASASVPEEPQGAAGEHGIDLRFPVDFTAEAAQSVRVPCVVGAELDADAPKDLSNAPSLVLRRLEPGESAWDLAKSCGAAIRDIQAANALPEGADLPRDVFLLIPRRRARQ